MKTIWSQMKTNNCREPSPVLSRRRFLQLGLGSLLLSCLTQCSDQGDVQSERVPSTYQASSASTSPTPLTVGTWIHSISTNQLLAASENGITWTRGYSIEYARNLVNLQPGRPCNHLAGFHIEAADLLANWQETVDIPGLQDLLQLEIELDGLIVGNELRNPRQNRFSKDIANALVLVLNAYREYLEEKGHSMRLSYAFEGAAIPRKRMPGWYEPLFDACDVVCVNLYPMNAGDWVGTDAFDANRKFLLDRNERRDRLDSFEEHLRTLLANLKNSGKSLILSETGMSSAIGYEITDGLFLPIHDLAAFADVFTEFCTRLVKVRQDFSQLEGIYFYEWWDNPWHEKIISENSPIHNSFGFVDIEGNPKFDIPHIVSMLKGA